MSSILDQETNKAERYVYFISKVFRYAETHFHEIEKPTLDVIIAEWKLRPYFQSHKIFVKTKYLVQQVLKKPNLAGRVVSWAVEFSKYDI